MEQSRQKSCSEHEGAQGFKEHQRANPCVMLRSSGPSVVITQYISFAKSFPLRDGACLQQLSQGSLIEFRIQKK